MNRFFPSLLIAAALALPACGADTPATTTSPSAASSAPAATRKFTTVAIPNPRSLAIDAAGNLYAGDVDSGKIIKITRAGEASPIGGKTTELISDPLGLAVSKDNTVFVADTSGNNVIKIPEGKDAAALPKQAQSDMLKSPTGVAVDSKGNAYITNNADNNILKITPDGSVSVFAGKSGSTGSADGKTADAAFTTPRGIAIDAKDNLYVADEGNSNIRKITPDGTVSTVAGKAGETGSADGQGIAATFGAPRSLAAAADGTLYIADTDNNTIRKISPSGLVSTLAGKPGETGDTDGLGPAARFAEPRGIAVDPQGNVYVADSGNAAIRQISPTGQVTTITGGPTPK